MSTTSCMPSSWRWRPSTRSCTARRRRRSVWREKRLYSNIYMGIVRSHFVVGPDGRLEDVQYKVSPEESVEAAVAYVTAKG